MHTQHLVYEFHSTFGHPCGAKPTMIDGKLAELRVKLIAEELAEYAASIGVSLTLHVSAHMSNVREAYTNIIVRHEPEAATDLIEAADALGDIDYVVQGANVVHGFDGPAVVGEIHRSNMSKLGADGQPIYREDGKIMKGPNYSPPNIGAVLRAFNPAASVWGEGQAKQLAERIVDGATS